ncbi:putative leader peptide [Streptomyces antibioticus]
MGDHGATGADRRPSEPYGSSPLLTSRRHIDLQRVCSALSARR